MPHIQFDVPYTPHASKNRKFAYRGKKFQNPQYKAFVQTVTIKTNNQCALQNALFKDRQKLWVNLVLVKTKRMVRTDAANFLESVCDGIKLALNIDDCWFAGSFDWELGAEPLIRLTLSQ